MTVANPWNQCPCTYYPTLPIGALVVLIPNCSIPNYRSGRIAQAEATEHRVRLANQARVRRVYRLLCAVHEGDLVVVVHNQPQFVGHETEYEIERR